MSDRHHSRAGAGLAALLFLAATAARAEGELSPKAVLQSAPAASAQAPVSPLSAFSIESSKDGSTASLKIGAQWNFIGQSEGRFTTGSLTFSAPVDDKRGFAAPLTQDGLGGAASIKVQLSALIVPAADFGAVDAAPLCQQAIIARAAQLGLKPVEGCSTASAYAVGAADRGRQFDQAIAAVDPGICADMRAAYLQLKGAAADPPSCGNDLAKQIGNAELAGRYARAVAALETQPICIDLKADFLRQRPLAGYPGCSAEVARQVGGAALATQYNGALDAARARRRLTYFGVSAKVGSESHAFYDPLTLAKSDVERTPWSVGAFYSLIGGDQTWSMTAEYKHQKVFEDGKARTACLAGPGPILSCVTGALEPVKAVTKDVLSLEGLWAPGRSDISPARFGIGPKIAVDLGNDQWAVALPVYLFGDKSGLTSGIRADWDSRDHRVVVGVFVTKALSITDLF